MSKENKVDLSLDIQTALEVLHVLADSTANYSQEFVPERIVRLRKVIETIVTKLEKYST
jgi:hypothetical protein